MHNRSATAISCPNIAFIKYWGDRDPALRIPANGSISMNLAGLFTRTCVEFLPSLHSDGLTLNGKEVTGPGLTRVSSFLDRVRRLAGLADCARVASENNFPTGAGIASSAAAFAALALAASKAAGLSLCERELSRLARTGSGSACRSIPAGFVEWQPGETDEDSFAFSIAPPEHWDLADCIAIVSYEHKPTGSTEGHFLANTSPLQAARVADAPRRLEVCRRAILSRDFEAFAWIVEQDCNLMHAVMITSHPQLLYWQPGTLAVMHAVHAWRRQNIPACYTIDAGPNVHVLCEGWAAEEVAAGLRQVPGVSQVMVASPGGAARLEN
jgi:diphosphomevalonate decarboxylase